MPKIQNPVRGYTETAIAGPSGQPSVVIRRRARGKARAALKAATETPAGPLDDVFEPTGRKGRPRELDRPKKVLVTLEQCDLKALRRWQRERGYRCRSAALRALIAETCGHE